MREQRHCESRTSRAERGSALILAIVLVAVLALGCAAVWQYMQGTLRQTSKIQRDTEAALLAESAVEHMLAYLETHPGTPEYALEGALGTGSYAASAKTMEDGSLQIHASGKALNGDISVSEHRLIVEATLTPGAPAILRWEEEKSR